METADMTESHYVYIIYSEQHDKYYRGYSMNPSQRLIQHNKGKSPYTSNYCPWNLIYVEELNDKSSALKREKVLKKYSKMQIKDLINLPKNCVLKFH
jgi:putative endonuclease